MPEPSPGASVQALPGPRSLADVLAGARRDRCAAVDGVSFEVRPGRCWRWSASRCGKTTTGNLLLGLLRARAAARRASTAATSAASPAGAAAAAARGPDDLPGPVRVAEPADAIGEIVAEPLRVHGVAGDRAELRRRVVEALRQAGMTPPEAYLHRLPFELSGGQRQRVVIAAALALEPGVLVADEPVSMLDVIDPRRDPQPARAALATDQGIAVVMITHDLSTVAAYADRIAVMYLGRIVEIGPTRGGPGRAPAPVHPRAAAPWCRCRIRPRARARSSSPARRRTRREFRPAAASTHAARWRSTAARRSTRRCSTSGRPRGRVPAGRGAESGRLTRAAADRGAATRTDCADRCHRARRRDGERERDASERAATTAASSRRRPAAAAAAANACASVGEALPTWRSPAITTPRMTMTSAPKRPAPSVACRRAPRPSWVAPVAAAPAARTAATR